MSVPISQGREAGRCIEKITTRYRAWNRCVQPYSHSWRAPSRFSSTASPFRNSCLFCPGARRHPALGCAGDRPHGREKGVCETACWSGTPHLPEALMLRAFNGKEFPKAFDTPFSEEALAALFPEETAGKLNWLVLPIACDADALGLLFVGRESGETEWPDRERDFLRLVCAMLGFFFAGKHIANSNRFISACSTRRWIR